MLHKEAVPVFQYNVDKEGSNGIDQLELFENFLTQEIALATSRKAGKRLSPVVNFFDLGLHLHYHLIIWIEPGYSIEACCQVDLSRERTVKELKGHSRYLILAGWQMPLDLPETLVTTVIQSASIDPFTTLTGMHAPIISRMIEELVEDIPTLK